MKILSYSGKPIISRGKAFVAPEAGGAFILIQSAAGATLACGDQTYTLGSDETSHAFAVSPGTYVCSAAKNGYSRSDSITVNANNAVPLLIIPPNLPSQYQEVKYLQSSRGQWIDTGYIGQSNSYYEVSFSPIYQYDSAVMFGVSDDSWDVSRMLGYISWSRYDDEMNVDIGICNEWGYNDDTQGIDKYLITYDETTRLGKIFNDDYGTPIEIFSNTFTGGAIPPNPFYLFSANIEDSEYYVEEYSTVARCYSLKIKTGEIMAVHLIPCYRKSDGKPGMYDVVSNRFLVNQGSGEFIVGPDVN